MQTTAIERAFQGTQRPVVARLPPDDDVTIVHRLVATPLRTVANGGYRAMESSQRSCTNEKPGARGRVSQRKTDASLSGDALLLATAQHDQAADEQRQATSGGGRIDLGGLGGACNHDVS
jgi:hypothetical protein